MSPPTKPSPSPTKTYHCPSCPKSFVSKFALVDHLKIQVHCEAPYISRITFTPNDKAYLIIDLCQLPVEEFGVIFCPFKGCYVSYQSKSRKQGGKEREFLQEHIRKVHLKTEREEFEKGSSELEQEDSLMPMESRKNGDAGTRTGIVASDLRKDQANRSGNQATAELEAAVGAGPQAHPTVETNVDITPTVACPRAPTSTGAKSWIESLKNSTIRNIFAVTEAAQMDVADMDGNTVEAAVKGIVGYYRLAVESIREVEEIPTGSGR
ncbi:hypothetical protein BJ508DRAFT_340951 [Ascobolus immersus RN42]|uniref:C2H2-type domain-containing protein n=1 Tax=Ascobolus immersus RN42 TaxID=1160509 RepID=A0A3N4HLH4_ASCIM|nr:hypothetical protein BJ508DRAFT_340951 [Ascobolus immersus RN42]